MEKRKPFSADENGRDILRKMGINFSRFKQLLRKYLTDELSEDEYVSQYNFMASVVNLFECKSVRQFVLGWLVEYRHIPFKDKYRKESDLLTP